MLKSKLIKLGDNNLEIQTRWECLKQQWSLIKQSVTEMFVEEHARHLADMIVFLFVSSEKNRYVRLSLNSLLTHSLLFGYFNDYC